MTAEFTHAGGIVVRVDRGVLHYLVVTARQHPEQWLFPKGHIDPGETMETAAAREVLEEAGVAAGIVAPVGTAEYVQENGRAVRAQFFLMRHLHDAALTEARRRRWCRYEEALQLLSWDTSRDLLRRARAVAEVNLPQ